jgi:hypothetical protein
LLIARGLARLEDHGNKNLAITPAYAHLTFDQILPFRFLELKFLSLLDLKENFSFCTAFLQSMF